MWFVLLTFRVVRVVVVSGGWYCLTFRMVRVDVYGVRCWCLRCFVLLTLEWKKFVLSIFFYIWCGSGCFEYLVLFKFRVF